MGLQIGIVGLPNVGKSTLFNALVKRRLAKTAPYPFTTLEPHEGVVDVYDERLDKLANLIKPEKVTPANITFIDIAGLVKGAHKGEGLGNEFLGQIKNVDVIAEVIRSFADENIQHVLGNIEPERDKEVVKTELILKDLETIKRFKEAKGQGFKEPKEKIKKYVIEKLYMELNEGKIARDVTLDDEQMKIVQDLNLLTTKPIFYIINIPEDKLNQKNINLMEDKETLTISAKMEEEITDLSSAEQNEYLQSYGIFDSGLTRIIKKAYELLDLLTFFTIKGGKEVRAWPIKSGKEAINAAALVHTDMAKGFIKAEVISYVDFVKIGNWNKAHEMGKIHLAGRDYKMKEGDVVEFRFSV